MRLLSRSAEHEAAYVDFVAARQAHLRRIAYSLCGDWHRAEDLLQTALTKAYVAWPRVIAAGRPEAYVRTIMVRANIDEHRRRAARPEWPTDRPPERPTASGADVVTRTALVEALQALPEMQRKAVVLRHLLDLSVEETAAELRLSPGTVKSHTSRGLAALREAGASALR